MANQRVNKEAKGDLAVTVATKSYQPTGPYYRSPNDLRSQFAGSRSYIRTPSGAYPNPIPKPYSPLPSPTGVEEVVPIKTERVRSSPTARTARTPSSRSATPSEARSKAPGTYRNEKVTMGGKTYTGYTVSSSTDSRGRTTKSVGNWTSSPDAGRSNAGRSNVTGPSNRSRTSSVSQGTGGRMTNAQRNEPASSRNNTGGSRSGSTRTSGASSGTGGRQTQSQRNEPAGPRGRSR